MAEASNIFMQRTWPNTKLTDDEERVNDARIGTLG